jgi:3-oxoacyl-[acyl-carrier-protein] synthase-1
MVFQSMNSTITMNLSALLGTRGASWTLSGACASGGHAVGQAADLISLGRQDVVICGGAQEIGWESVCSFDALCAFSTREDEPLAASRPFDADRDGLVPSGGAAALVLENWERATSRGAEILGEVKAYAFSADGSHIAVPNGDGIARAMAEVLERAELQAQDIDYVCAHGTSTPVGDAVEAEAIASVFADSRPWVSSTKAQTGHEMWMSGASQVVYSLLAARRGFLPGNLNFVRPDDRTASIRVAAEPVHEAPELILCNAAGFGGTNSTLIIRVGA